jgi:hypothetical protein
VTGAIQPDPTDIYNPRRALREARASELSSLTALAGRPGMNGNHENNAMIFNGMRAYYGSGASTAPCR